jgi:hypothetical protein
MDTPQQMLKGETGDDKQHPDTPEPVREHDGLGDIHCNGSTV